MSSSIGKRKRCLQQVRRKNEGKQRSPTELLTECGSMERNWREVRTEDERNARAASELSEGGSPKRDPEGNVGDLCSMHKGLAQVFEDRRKI